MTDRRMESLNDVKHIVNGKDRYTDGKILKTDMGYVPELQEEASRTEVVVGGGGQRTATCQILVAPPFVVHVVMQ
jgi:hypothetical protein